MNVEKVIKGLECRSTNLPNRDCENCRYGMTMGRRWGCDFMRLCGDALALLKAQEPRVLALDEIHRGMAVWLEDVDKADVILAIGGSSAGGAKCFITENDTSIAPLSAEYGIRWRAWTAEPTDEQREATTWKRMT